jgi:large subunit ribosomal protein L9
MGSKKMEVILLERVQRLGQMGEVVNVKDGYARNYLLPQSKALRATNANRAQFEKQKTQLEAQNLEKGKEAQVVADKLEGEAFVVLRQAGESGQLYGSVNTRDIAEAATAGGFSLNRDQVVLDTPIKVLGLHSPRIVLHPEVSCSITINVARSAEEAELQAKGVDVNIEQEDEDTISADDVFDSEELAQAAEADLSDEEAPAEEAASEAPAEKAAEETKEV